MLCSVNRVSSILVFVDQRAEPQSGNALCFREDETGRGAGTRAQVEVTTAGYQAAMGVPNRTAKNHLRKLTELGPIHPSCDNYLDTHPP